MAMNEMIVSCLGAVSSWDNIVTAYEPLWAVGTGQAAPPEKTQEVHVSVSGLLEIYQLKLPSRHVSMEVFLIYFLHCSINVFFLLKDKNQLVQTWFSSCDILL